MAEGVVSEKQSWGFSEGDEIVPGRYAMRTVGGGRDYEALIAWDDELSCLVITKILRPDQITDRNLRELRREAHILGSLSHPMIVRCFDAVIEGERPHLVLEYFQGETLRRLIRHGAASLEQALPLALSLCSALHFLRLRGIVHLDIKSRNVIMDVPPRLIDFSVARPVTEAEKIKGPVGTKAYMAPEQCDPLGRGPVGPAADMWGFGATLYRAVNGHVPFPATGDEDSGDPQERFPQLWRPPEPFRSEIPSPLCDLITRCLNPDPAQRPEPLEVARDLEPLVAALPRKPVLRRARPR